MDSTPIYTELQKTLIDPEADHWDTSNPPEFVASLDANTGNAQAHASGEHSASESHDSSGSHSGSGSHAGGTGTHAAPGSHAKSGGGGRRRRAED